jgi:hypothetical protein
LKAMSRTGGGLRIDGMYRTTGVEAVSTNQAHEI